MSDTAGITVAKAIILGSGRSEVNGSQSYNMPACLLGDTFGSRVLDWILGAFNSVDVKNVVFVGGFRISDIAEKYKKLKYIYNYDWESTGVLESLNKAKSEFDTPLFVSYADIVFTPHVCRKMLEEGEDGVTVAVDTSWRMRGSVKENEIRKNMVMLGGGYVKEVGFLPVSNRLDAEFIGLALFSRGSLAAISSFFEEYYPVNAGKPFEQSSDTRKAYLTDLIRHLIKTGVPVKAVDIGSDWAEMDDPKDLCRFVIGTKAQTLDRLSSVVKKGRFCRQFAFTVENQQKDETGIVDEIQRRFSPGTIVVRSSTIVEDSWLSSYAGHFKSITGVDSTDRDAVSRAVREVIDSYETYDREQNAANQVLVQEMVCDVVMSGVVFTRDLETGAPYYVINYDDRSDKTDTVTSGNSDNLKTLLAHRDCVEKIQSREIRALLDVVREIEVSTGSSTLDIEFAINARGEVFVLQTRPLTCVSQDETFSLSEKCVKINRIRDFLKGRFAPAPGLYGKSTIFGDMPDWNPVEMIGSRPRPLAVSMYHYLISNSAWRTARGRVGYKDPEPYALMSVIGGHPYIDVRCSFNSLLPAKLSPDLSEKLVNYYIERLRAHPDMHDKVEFEVMVTCLDFNFREESKRFLNAGFTEDEIGEFRNGLLALTDDIICGRAETVSSLAGELETLSTRRRELLDSCVSVSEAPSLIGRLLDDCINYGTIPFSILARYAFIANSFLNSLVARGAFTPEDRQAFLGSIETVATELVGDMVSGGLSRGEFLSKYGHLRPGTYDITSYRYDEKPDYYFPGLSDASPVADRPEPEPKKYELSAEKRYAVEALIEEAGFNFTTEQLFGFMRDSIRYREFGKFEFTKTVSDILSILGSLGKECGFAREDLSYLNIEQVRLWGINAYICDISEMIASEIETGKRWFRQSYSIRLPHLITCPDDIEVMYLSAMRPNFVTLKKVTGSVQHIDNNTPTSAVKGKIVLIEGADPGFDWIFAHGITGLITKYGGAASHMTIRAAEFGIPAAIGCGEYLFNKLLSASKITLDSGGQTIHVI